MVRGAANGLTRIGAAAINFVTGRRIADVHDENVPQRELEVRVPNLSNNAHFDVDDEGYNSEDMKAATRASIIEAYPGYFSGEEGNLPPEEIYSIVKKIAEDIVPQAPQNLPAENDDVLGRIREEDRKIISDTNKEYEESQAIDAAKANTKVSDECSASVHEIFGKVNLGTLPSLFESETQSIDIAEYADIIAA
ncbi:MAG: hypothetical protein LBT64_03620, partial [Puniceicoccales bacterium]|nr:hypothetical protein [Puniceicoccales bacterium]